MHNLFYHKKYLYCHGVYFVAINHYAATKYFSWALRQPTGFAYLHMSQGSSRFPAYVMGSSDVYYLVSYVVGAYEPSWPSRTGPAPLMNPI